MGELVPNHTGKFPGAQHVEQTGRGRDRGVLRIAPGRKCIGLRVVHQIDARHRQPGAGAEIAHETDKLGSSTS
jgi:hypothetical protein